MNKFPSFAPVLRRSAETVTVGDRLTSHGGREIPFPGVATVVAKDPAGTGQYRFRLALRHGIEDAIIVVSGEHPMNMAPPE